MTGAAGGRPGNVLNGRSVGAGPAKTVRLKVLYAMSGYHGLMTLFGSMDVLVTLGNGESFILQAGNKSPGNVIRVMNGTVAIAVIEILKHPKVRAYLASATAKG